MESLDDYERNITHLSRNGLGNLCSEKETGIVVQVLETRKLGSSFQILNSKSAYRVTISDGFAKLGVVFINRAAEKVESQKLSKHTIIRITDSRVHQETKALAVMVSDFKTINANVKGIIGKPAEYQDFVKNGFKNHQGSNEIPDKFLTLEARQKKKIQSTSSFFERTARAPEPEDPFNIFPSQYSFGAPDEESKGLFEDTGIFRDRSARKHRPGAMDFEGPSEENRFIAELTPFDNTWVIKARIVKKGDIREWHNAKSVGRLFTIRLLDAAGDEIEAVFFNEAVEHFLNALVEDQVYFFSGGTIKKDDGARSIGYKIVFERDAKIIPAEEEGNIPKAKFNFTKIGNLRTVGDIVDIVGILMDVDEVQEVSLKGGAQKPRRNITVYDDSMNCIQMTLWGKDAQDFHRVKGDVIAVKSAKIGDFGGKNLQRFYHTKIFTDIDSIQEAQELRQWRDEHPVNPARIVHIAHAIDYSRTSEVVNILEILNTMASGIHPGQQYLFNVDGFLAKIFTDRSLTYKACPIKACNRKVTEVEGGWHCDGCQKNFDKYDPKYIVQAQVCDYSDYLRVVIYDDEARELFGGRSAEEMEGIKEKNPALFKEICDEITFRTFNFVVLAKYDSFLAGFPVKFQVKTIKPVSNLHASQKALRILANCIPK